MRLCSGHPKVHFETQVPGERGGGGGWYKEGPARLPDYQGWIYFGSCTCCHSEREVAGQTCWEAWLND